MKYFISNSDYACEGFINISVEESIEHIKNFPILEVDTETEGFFPHESRLLLMQIGTKDSQYVIDALTVDIALYKTILETHTIIFHNAKFDLRFLFHHGIFPVRNVICTFLQETLLHNGDKTRRKSLQACALNYLGIELDKEARGLIHRLGIYNPIVLNYSANDVVYLQKINKLQRQEGEAKDLLVTYSLDNEFVCALAYIEYCGMKLNNDKWSLKMQYDVESKEGKLKELNSYFAATYSGAMQLSLFSTASINWDSPKEVIKVFNDYGMDLDIVDKKTGKVKKSVESKTIDKYKKHFPIVKLYLEYKKAAKLCSTYGESFITQLSLDGRLRTNYNQVMTTGRLSSGADKENSESEGADVSNLQNITRVPEPKNRTRKIYERECFEPEEGNEFIVCDYSQQEQVLLANITKDEALLDFFLSGESDMHSFNAKKVYPELADLTAEEIKEFHADKRSMAKQAGFAINYGGSGITIAFNVGISIEQGNEMYNSYMKAFPGLANYFKKQEEFLKKNHYILISPITRRKYFPYKFKSLMGRFYTIDWDRYRNDNEYKNQTKNSVLKVLSGEVRKAINMPIQGAAADMMKIAIINIYQWIVKNNLMNIVKICNTIHDEVVIEAPKHLIPTVADKTKYFMEKAGIIFCPIVPVKADPFTGNAWAH